MNIFHLLFSVGCNLWPRESRSLHDQAHIGMEMTMLSLAFLPSHQRGNQHFCTSSWPFLDHGQLKALKKFEEIFSNQMPGWINSPRCGFEYIGKHVCSKRGMGRKSPYLFHCYAPCLLKSSYYILASY